MTKNKYLCCFIIMCLSLTGCGAIEEKTQEIVVEQIVETIDGSTIMEDVEAVIEDIQSADTIDDENTNINPAPILIDEEKVIEQTDETEEAVPDEEETFFLKGYETESDYKNRHTGSASYITEKTVIVSIFVNEPEDVWFTEETEYVHSMCDIAFGYIKDELKNEYNTDVELIYDWKIDPDLSIEIDVNEEIPTYVTSKQEDHIDDLEDEWIESVNYKALLEKYDTTSIAFLYLIPHEGCSYSSMHFMKDDEKTWNEGCLIYLEDYYSDTYDRETPSTYAHELLHLFGAEDFYASAEVFSKETYVNLEKNCAEDLMYSVSDTINGVYTTYPNKVRGKITPVTAYLLGVESIDAIADYPELEKEEKACFSGSAKDRPF